MIEQLKGKVTYTSTEYIILDVSGVGYKLFVTEDMLTDTSNKTEMTIWTYLAVRENSLDLYGFLNIEDLEFFKLLLSISGIGPKSALGVLAVADTNTLKSAISTGDISYLTRVSGIGKKSAERIVIELKDKVGSVQSEGSLKEDADTMDALVAMGYQVALVRNALKQLPNNKEKNTSSRIKEVLKLLTNNTI